MGIYQKIINSIIYDDDNFNNYIDGCKKAFHLSDSILHDLEIITTKDNVFQTASLRKRVVFKIYDHYVGIVGID